MPDVKGVLLPAYVLADESGSIGSATPSMNTPRSSVDDAVVLMRR